MLLRDDGATWDWAVNCAGETRYGQTDAIYEEGIFNLSLNCARESKAAGVGSYLEISCCVASNKRQAHKENDPIDPVTKIAKLKARAEEEISKIEGIRRVILRPGVVYGPGDKSNLGKIILSLKTHIDFFFSVSFLILGAIYNFLGERLRLLWSATVKMNTVHVKDVCRAVEFVLTRAGSPSDFDIYHVVDDSDTTLGSVCEVVGDIFGIETSFGSSFIYDLAKVFN